ncbi:MAG: hypothetical protein ACYTBJ_20960 [Planctomycetota bacterium]|jgi:hypothetical protein
MRKTVVILLVSVTFAVPTLRLNGADSAEGVFELKCHKVEDWRQPHIIAAAQRARRLPAKPARLKGLPKGLSDELTYLVAELGREKTVLVLDRVNHKLCVDFDCDLDLSEKELLAGERAKPRRIRMNLPESEVYVFGPAYLQLWETGEPEDGNAVDKVPEGDDAAPDKNQNEQKGHGIWFYVEVCDNRHVMLYPGTCRTGQIKVGKDHYQLAILDKNFDGVFSTLPVSKLLKHDMITIDLNRDGLFRGSREIYSLKHRLRIRGRLYDLAVAFDGSGVILSEPVVFVPPIPVMGRGPIPKSMAFAPRIRGIPRVTLKKCRAGG